MQLRIPSKHLFENKNKQTYQCYTPTVVTYGNHHQMDVEESHSKMPEALAEVPAQLTKLLTTKEYEIDIYME